MFTCLSPLTGFLVLQVHRSSLFHIYLTSLGAWYSKSAYKWLWNSHKHKTWGMRTSGCPKWNEVVKRSCSRRDWSPRMETSSARFCSAHNGQLVSQAKGGSSKQQLMYLSANKGSWFSTGTFVRESLFSYFLVSNLQNNEFFPFIRVYKLIAQMTGLNWDWVSVDLMVWI